MLAFLHLKWLVGNCAPKTIRTALKKLPTGSKAYDHSYKYSTGRIPSQLARGSLSWLVKAKRPLLVSELRQALAVEIGESDLDEDICPTLKR
jgi:hypothetical protein